MSRASTLALSAWGPAKETSNFEALRPHLEKNLELRHRYIECFDPPEETYDVLLDNFEPNMKTAEVREIFDELKENLVPLIKEIADAGEVDDSFLHGQFDIDDQRAFSLDVLHRFGYTEDEWRLDQTAHPFMCTPGHRDIRLTTNFTPGRPELALRDDARVRPRRLRVGCRRGVRDGRRSTPACRSACTSLRAERGRTSSGAAARSGATSIRSCKRPSRRSWALSTKKSSIAP